ncbi:unnamed protein product [Leptosia nina]|uniref:Uncharacterized protein n=1 Tax=Leptosia nina TaxID=320188 RepID=A0AAV1J6K4_9NEOP
MSAAALSTVRDPVSNNGTVVAEESPEPRHRGNHRASELRGKKRRGAARWAAGVALAPPTYERDGGTCTPLQGHSREPSDFQLVNDTIESSCCF